MRGSEYVAVVDLTDRKGDVLAPAGATCERVPASSLVWLKEQGHVRPAPKAARGGETLEIPTRGEE
jgi:hypothetical protein